MTAVDAGVFAKLAAAGMARSRARARVCGAAVRLLRLARRARAVQRRDRVTRTRRSRAVSRSAKPSTSADLRDTIAGDPVWVSSRRARRRTRNDEGHNDYYATSDAARTASPCSSAMRLAAARQRGSPRRSVSDYATFVDVGLGVRLAGQSDDSRALTADVRAARDRPVPRCIRRAPRRRSREVPAGTSSSLAPLAYVV